MNRILRIQNNAGRRVLAAQNYVDAELVGQFDNERDRILQATYPRSAPDTDKLLLLISSDNDFTISAKGAVTPASITFTPIILGMTGTVAYGASAGATLTFPGGVPTLNYGDMPGEECVVSGSITVNGLTYTSVPIKIKKVHETEAEEITTETVLDLLENQITESQLYADLRSRIDLVDGPASNPSTVQGQIKKETDLRVSAINQEIADRIAALVAEAGARTTYVQSFTYSKQDITNAISIKADAITAGYTAYADSTKAQAKADSAADVRQYAYSKADIDSSEAAQTNTITTNYKSYADGVGATATSNANSYIQTYAYGKSTIDSTLASLATQLRSEFTDNNGVTVAYLNNYAFSKAETNSAISSATQTLSTTVAGHTTSIQQQFTSIDGLSGQLVWKIDSDNHVTGFGLASTPINGAPYSTMIFNVDVLAVALPGGAGKPIFTVGQVGGQSQAVFRTDLFVDGAITARMLKIGSSDNIIPDPQFRDLDWWGFVGKPISVAQWADGGQQTSWKGGTSVYLGASGNVLTPCESQWFNMEPGASYRVDFQLSLTADFNGSISVWWHLPSVAFYPMCGPVESNGVDVGAWPDGRRVQFNTSSPKDLRSFSHIVTLPNNTLLSRGQILIRWQSTAGFAEVGAMAITRAVDTVLIKDGAVTASKILVNSLQAISNIVTARSGGVGAGIDQDQNGIRIYAPNSMRVVQLGNLDV